MKFTWGEDVQYLDVYKNSALLLLIRLVRNGRTTLVWTYLISLSYETCMISQVWSSEFYVYQYAENWPCHSIVFNWKVASTKEEPRVPIFMKGEARKTACLFIWLQYTLNVSRNPILYCRTLRHNIRTLYANEILSIHNYDLTHMILVSSESSLIFVT